MHCNVCFNVVCVCRPCLPPLPPIVTYASGPVVRPDLCDASELIQYPLTPLEPTSLLQRSLHLFANDCSQLDNCNAVQIFSVGMCKTTVAAIEPKLVSNDVTGLLMTLNLSSLRFDLPTPKYVCVQVVNQSTRKIYRVRECLSNSRANLPCNIVSVNFTDPVQLNQASFFITIKYEFC